ncbi:hypothetical protein VKT23_007425 [Stygiomarasmius scandens]|uniref:Uncharacterized protein n=1 Tax=Marasmiellus scandens TaxID=2682957 RepID=A0ABR1JJV1_9AGAR
MSSAMNSSVSMQESRASGNVYIPIHKRGGSRSSMEILSPGGVTDNGMPSSLSSTSSLSSLSPRSATFGGAVVSDGESLGSPSRSAPIYTISELFTISRSPLVSLSPKKREEIRNSVPEIYMNRKQRQARAVKETQSTYNQFNSRSNVVGRNVDAAEYQSSLPFSRSLRKHAQWQEQKDQHVSTSPRSAVFTQLQNVAQPKSRSVPPKPLPLSNQTSSQRRVRRTVERRRSPKAIVDEMSWRTVTRGIRQRTWSAQGIVVPSQ